MGHPEKEREISKKNLGMKVVPGETRRCRTSQIYRNGKEVKKTT